MSNVKESKEAVQGMLLLGAMLYNSFKDGVQASDFATIVAKLESNPELKQALLDAYNDADKCPDEIKAIDFAGGIELATAVITALPQAIDIANGK